MSKEKKINNLYAKISEIAVPGDLLFFISHNPFETYDNKKNAESWLCTLKSKIRSNWKQWLGIDKHDLDAWHIGIFYMAKKRKSHSRINPWIIHSTMTEGVHLSQITPQNFTVDASLASRRIELLRYKGITEEQRKTIINYSYSKIGNSFDKSSIEQTMLPYICGLPNLYYDRAQFSCQQLVIASYAAAEIYFAHPFKSFPMFNIGRYLGHPLGHPRDRVNPRYPYLMDHHIYRDPRFQLKATIYQEPETGEFQLQQGNLYKYSWSKILTERYRKWI